MFNRQYSVLGFPRLWRIDVRRDGTVIQGGISVEGSLCRDRHRRSGYNTMGMLLRDVVSSRRSFSGCRDYHAEISEMAILGGTGGICLRLCRSAGWLDIKIPVLLSQAGRDNDKIKLAIKPIRLQR